MSGALTGQGRFDASTTDIFKFSLAGRGAKSIVIEFAADGNLASNGQVNVFIGEAISGAPPWFAVLAGTVRVYPSPDADQISIVPGTGALGICTVSLSQENLGVGIYPFDGGGGGGTSSPFIAQSVFSQAGYANPETLTFADAPAKNSVLMLFGTFNTNAAATSIVVAGWTLLVSYFDASSNSSAAIWVRAATGDAADNPTIAGISGESEQFYAVQLIGGSSTAAMPHAGGAVVTGAVFNPTAAIAVAAGSLVFALYYTSQVQLAGLGWQGCSPNQTSGRGMFLETLVAGAASTVIGSSTSNGYGGGACVIAAVAPR